ncbi:uncharacterized protein LOC129617732 [Condylostylus longicornis]|uniref:uncharacterized protein LOC129617732 n=1 Tax=Condylostylus longicornis TaxID=2530218 RepID=UPI00244E265C|nr:uncharacterized protein LOC129617732 [Condylostylus longicornis]
MVRKRKPTKKQASTSTSESQITDLLDAAANCLCSFPPDEVAAAALYEKALALDSTNIQALSCFAELLCTAENPSTLAGMKRDVEEVLAIRRQMSNACCAIAELYMTDLCDEPEAEARVAECLNMAIELDPENFDAYTGLTTYFKTIGNLEEAAESAEKALILFKRAKAQAEAEDLDHLMSAAPNETVVEVPEWNSRLSLAASLIDLKQTIPASELLESLIEENDQDIQAWHLMACNFLVAQDFDSSEDCLDSGKELIARAAKQASIGDEEHQNFVSHWTRVLAATEQQIEKSRSIAPQQSDP